MRYNRFKEGRTFVTGVGEIAFTSAVYRDTTWHFDSKERLFDVGVHRLQEVSVSRLVFSRSCGLHSDNPAVGAYPQCVLSHRRKPMLDSLCISKLPLIFYLTAKPQEAGIEMLAALLIG